MIDFEIFIKIPESLSSVPSEKMYSPFEYVDEIEFKLFSVSRVMYFFSVISSILFYFKVNGPFIFSGNADI